MNDDQLREQIRALDAVQPRAAFRARVRDEFIRSEAPVTALPRRRRAVVFAAFAAAAVLALALLALPARSVWTVDPGSEQNLTVTQGSLSPSGTLSPGTRLVARGESPVFLRVGNALRCWLSPGTEVTLEGQPRLGSRELRITVHRGALLASTGEEFPGEGLLVQTDELRTMIRGTTFGVLKGADSTCVCVLEGRVQSGAPGTDGQWIEPGFAYALYVDGRESGRVLNAMESRTLQDLRSSVAARD